MGILVDKSALLAREWHATQGAFMRAPGPLTCGSETASVAPQQLRYIFPRFPNYFRRLSAQFHCQTCGECFFVPLYRRSIVMHEPICCKRERDTALLNCAGSALIRYHTCKVCLFQSFQCVVGRLPLLVRAYALLQAAGVPSKTGCDLTRSSLSRCCTTDVAFSSPQNSPQSTVNHRKMNRKFNRKGDIERVERQQNNAEEQPQSTANRRSAGQTHHE